MSSWVTPRTVTCNYCNKAARLVGGDAIYPHRPDLFGKRFWQCTPCDAYVGCHPTSRNHAPLGKLARADERAARSRAHQMFDPIWRNGTMTRSAAYAWLSNSTGIAPADCHIGMMTVAQCELVVSTIIAAGLAGHPCTRQAHVDQ